MRKFSALVVEDDEELGEIFVDLLETTGLKVERVGDGQLALDSLKQFTPDIMMLDMHLPRVSGLEILQQVRADARLQNIEVVIVTADALLSNVVRDQADFVLIKPVDYSQLNTLIERLAG